MWMHSFVFRCVAGESCKGKRLRGERSSSAGQKIPATTTRDGIDNFRGSFFSRRQGNEYLGKEAQGRETVVSLSRCALEFAPSF